MNTLLLSACSGDPSGREAAVNGSADLAPSAAAAPPARPVFSGGALGLSFGSQQARFGAPFADAVALAKAAGGGSELTRLNECGAGSMVATRSGDLSLLGQGDQFVGWHASGKAAPPLRTDRGIGIGSLRRDLQAAHDVEVFESSLGTEFYVPNGLGGLLSGPTPDAQVTHLWAGTTCTMR